MCLTFSRGLKAWNGGPCALFADLLGARHKTFFERRFIFASFLLWVASANAQAFMAQEDLRQSLILDFLPAKRDLTGVSAQALKRLFSRFSQVQDVTALIEEDGSYLESLCEERASSLFALLMQMGAPRSQTRVSCSPPNVSISVSGAFMPTVLNARGLGPEVAGASGKEGKGSRGRPKNASKPAVSLAAGEASLDVKPSSAMQLAAGDGRPKELQSTERAKASPALPSRAALSEGGTLPVEKKELEDPGLMKKKGHAPIEDFTRIAKGRLLDSALQALAESQGWTFIWYPNFTWRAIADIDLTLYPNAQSAVTQLVGLLRLEGKPIQLRVSEGNKVMEILSTQVNND